MSNDVRRSNTHSPSKSICGQRNIDKAIHRLISRSNTFIAPTPVASSETTVEHGISLERRFPLAFFDRSLLAAESKLATIPVWTIRVTSSVNAGSTEQPWRALWWLMSLAAVASLVSVILIAQSVSAIAENAAARSEFVATVTHDLKTPLALVRAVGETLEHGRYPPDRRIDEYGRLLRPGGVALNATHR